MLLKHRALIVCVGGIGRGLFLVLLNMKYHSGDRLVNAKVKRCVTLVGRCRRMHAY